MKRRTRISFFAVSVLALGAVESILAAPDSAETAVTGSAELWASVSTLSVSASSTQATMQMVAPIALSSKKVPLMITRTTLPYVTTPDLGAPVGRQR
jgi:hypothetical protein